MPAPTLEKAWAYDVNRAVIAGATLNECGQRVAIQLKNSILALPGWTVRGSSNSLVAGMDGVDRLVTYPDWVSRFGAGTRSWIVLRNTLFGNWELLIEGSAPSLSSEYAYLRMLYSVGGLFTGGSTTARPTATDELSISTNVSGQLFINGTIAPHVVHAQGTTDGSQLRIWVCSNAAAVFGTIVGAMADPLTGIPAGFWGSNQSGTSGTPAGAWSAWSHATLGPKIAYGGVATAVSLSTLAIQNSAWTASNISSLPNAAGEWALANIVVASNAIPSPTIFGRCIDLWAGPSVRGVGATFPEDGSNTLAQFGELTTPWNGTNPVTG